MTYSVLTDKMAYSLLSATILNRIQNEILPATKKTENNLENFIKN